MRGLTWRRMAPYDEVVKGVGGEAGLGRLPNTGAAPPAAPGTVTAAARALCCCSSSCCRSGERCSGDVLHDRQRVAQALRGAALREQEARDTHDEAGAALQQSGVDGGRAGCGPSIRAEATQRARVRRALKRSAEGYLRRGAGALRARTEVAASLRGTREAATARARGGP